MSTSRVPGARVVPLGCSEGFSPDSERGHVGSLSSRTWYSLILCGGALIFCLGQYAGAVQREKVLRADAVVAGRFELTDSEGKSVASLHTKGDGEVLLSFYGEKGSLRLDLGVSPGDGPGLRFYDARGRSRLTLSVGAVDDVPRVRIVGAASDDTIDVRADDIGPRMVISRQSATPGLRREVSMGLDSQGAPKIRLSGPGKNHPLISLWVDELIGPQLSFSENTGGRNLPRLVLDLDDGGDPSINLFGRGANLGLYMRVGPSGPFVSMAAEKGYPSTTLRLLPDGSPSMYLQDDQGRTTATLSVGKDGEVTVHGAKGDRK